MAGGARRNGCGARGLWLAVAIVGLAAALALTALATYPDKYGDVDVKIDGQDGTIPKMVGDTVTITGTCSCGGTHNLRIGEIYGGHRWSYTDDVGLTPQEVQDDLACHFPYLESFVVTQCTPSAVAITATIKTAGDHTIRATCADDNANPPYDHGADEEVLSVIDISLAASQSWILAGNGSDAAGQAVITVTVTPSSLTGTVSFSIVSGTGQGVYTPASLSDADVSLSSGQAQTTLYASDAVEIITVSASFGGRSRQISVWTECPTCNLTVEPDYIDSETQANVTATLTWGASPVSDRSVEISVVGVLLLDGTYVTTNLSSYASISNGSMSTDSNGVATGDLDSGPSIDQCSQIYVALVDHDAWIPE